MEFVDSGAAARAMAAARHNAPAAQVPLSSARTTPLADTHSAATPPASTPGQSGQAAAPRRVQGLSSPATGEPMAGSLRRHENGQLVWRVPCGDLIHRERCITILIEKNQLVVVGPPGETARLTLEQLGQLRSALSEAARYAERSR